jgi:hypothetical protein
MNCDDNDHDFDKDDRIQGENEPLEWSSSLNINLFFLLMLLYNIVIKK